MMLHDLQFWVPVLTGALGANGAIWALIQWRINHRKLPTDTAAAFTAMAERLAAISERGALREHEDNEKLRAEVRALREEVEKLRPLQAEVVELRQRLARMHQDVTATRTAVERQVAEEMHWLGIEAPKSNE